MKTLTLIISFAIIANFTGCALRVYEDGKPVVSDSSNSNGELYVKTKGGTIVSFKGVRDNATPTKVAMHGAHKLFADAVTGAIGLSTPGNGAVSNLVKGGGIIAPQVNSTQSNSPSVK